MDHHRPFALVGLFVTGTVAGAALGALCNSINGWLSPHYFRNIFRGNDVQDLWRASLAQGIFEGLLFGIFLSLVFVIVAGLVSKVRCSYRFGATVLLAVVAIALVCWLIGGLVGIGLAALSPDFFRHAFRGAPSDCPDMLRFAWVGGSILGLQFGGVAALILESFAFYARWQRQERKG